MDHRLPGAVELRNSAKSARLNKDVASKMNRHKTKQSMNTVQGPRFGIAEIMLATLIVCVLATAGNYLKDAFKNGQGRAMFAIFTLASPMALVLMLSAYLALKRWVKSMQPRK